MKTKNYSNRGELVSQSFFVVCVIRMLDITAVVTVADDGGSSGDLRDIMQLTPPGTVMFW